MNRCTCYNDARITCKVCREDESERQRQEDEFDSLLLFGAIEEEEENRDW